MTTYFKPMRRKFGVLTLVLAFVAMGAWGVIEFAKWRHAVNYPYGWSHCCIKQFTSALDQYANAHDGHYPGGKECPEASLSLLHYQRDGLNANLLRGKTVPEEVVQAVFDQEGFLDPDTCGWHYVEGLTQNDDTRLAILWDKVGLGHNGQRDHFGREVLLLSGSVDRIPGAEWPKFLKEQERMLANRDESAVKGEPFLVGTIKLPSGELLDYFKGRYQLEQSVSSTGGGSNGIASGEHFGLKWMRRDFQMDGQMRLVLEFPDLGLRSKPVTFQVENQRPSTSLIVFEMEETK